MTATMWTVRRTIEDRDEGDDDDDDNDCDEDDVYDDDDEHNGDDDDNDGGGSGDVGDGGGGGGGGASERSTEDQAIPQLRQLGSSGVRRHLKCNDSTPSPHTQDRSHEDGTYKRSDFKNSGS